MKNRIAIGAIGAVMLGASAQAGTVDLEFEVNGYGMTSGGSQVAMGAGDYGVMDLYVTFNTGSPVTKVLSLIDMNIGLDSGSFVHNDAAATNHWSAQYSAAGLGGDAAIDSFVTMGPSVSGDPFVATLDPNFDGSIGGSVSADAGWYNGDPTNGQGVVNGDYKVFIGRFVVANADVIGNQLSISGTVSYRLDGSTPGDPSFQAGSIVYTMPSTPVVPGPAGVLAIAGIAVARRRCR